MNIFVANLSFKFKDDQLRKIFEPYGEIESVRIITDRNSGRSKGYGFVVMPNEEEADKAIKELNGLEVDGRALVVKVSEEKQEPKRFTGRRP
ncbi:MAG TPA: RNA-binding protein [Bacteroidales bacterium]|nr:RNA-binding protein [Bacteroidales bacterium]HRW95900.1 RNA-binding protein [Bacteroidales bacterium]